MLHCNNTLVQWFLFFFLILSRFYSFLFFVQCEKRFLVIWKTLSLVYKLIFNKRKKKCAEKPREMMNYIAELILLLKNFLSHVINLALWRSFFITIDIAKYCIGHET